jgi:tRNA-2-methylthio-N6-dimethylallyladenosine synthase
MQSGSDRLLREMRRSYRSDRYLAWLDRIRDAVPGVAVTTDIIVGFPGETEEDFQGTLRVTERARFDAAFTFQYSPRPGTVAADFDGHVPKPVVQERFDRLVVLQERISLERNRELVGRTVEVLVEGEGRKGNRKGRTRTNKLVHAAGDIAPGTFAHIAVTGAHPHHLDGRLVPGPSASAMPAVAAG